MHRTPSRVVLAVLVLSTSAALAQNEPEELEIPTKFVKSSTNAANEQCEAKLTSTVEFDSFKPFTDKEWTLRRAGDVCQVAITAIGTMCYWSGKKGQAIVREKIKKVRCFYDAKPKTTGGRPVTVELKDGVLSVGHARDVVIPNFVFEDFLTKKLGLTQKGADE